MPYLYCTCGAKNEFSGNRPKKCHSCDSPFDRSFEPPPRIKAAKHRPHHYQEPEELEYAEETLAFDGHVSTESTPKVTVESFIKSGAEVERPTLDPETAKMRKELIGKLLPVVSVPRSQPST